MPTLDKVSQTGERLYNAHSDGYIAMVSVLIGGAIALAIAVPLLLLGIATSRTSFAYEQAQQARGLANACAEEALQDMKDAAACADVTDSLTLGEGSCTYTVVSSSAQACVITSTGTVESTVRRVEVDVIQTSPSVEVLTWREVASF